MGNTNGGAPLSDALVLFGVTGDLARKRIFPALYALAKRGDLDVPVVGVAASGLSSADLRERARESIAKAGGIDDPAALDRLLSRLEYVSGDYNDAATFAALDPVLTAHGRALAYPPGTWEPKEADALIAADGGWHDPLPEQSVT
ncbi:MAG: hypothetical protein ACOY4M_10200 [Pseudomonadota bacterium]